MYKIGVLDDDETWCLIIERLLSKEFEVFTYRRVFSFLQEINQYDLVIVDFSIPPAPYEKGMDGSEIIMQIKKTVPNPPLLVLVTGFLSASNLEVGREICPEADAFIAKDAGIDAILKEIKRLLASKEKENKPLAG